MQSIAAFEQHFITELSHLYGASEIKQIYALLVEEHMEWTQAQYILNRGSILTEDNRSWLLSSLSDLISGKPVQYIVGHTWFMGIQFSVSGAALIPRPETEELVDMIVNRYKTGSKPLRIIDIGTGTGCIAIALKKALPQAHVYALDVSADALQLARQNATDLSVEIDFIHADILEWELIFADNQQFDIVVSNPPYITEAEQQDMHQNVLAFEPHLALFVEGAAPLLFYDHIADFARHHLRANGNLYVECNRNYGTAVADLFRKKGFDKADLHRDMLGADRIVRAEFISQTENVTNT